MGMDGVTPPCGYCLKASMTVNDAGNDGGFCVKSRMMADYSRYHIHTC